LGHRPVDVCPDGKSRIIEGDIPDAVFAEDLVDTSLSAAPDRGDPRWAEEINSAPGIAIDSVDWMLFDV